MKKLTKNFMLAFLSIPLFIGMSSCNKTDDVVIITYQHLANFKGWSLENTAGNTQTGRWHVYMIRGIINKAKDAKPFSFNIEKLTTKNGGTINSASSPMFHSGSYTLPTTFAALVTPNQAFTIPFGTGELLYILDVTDTDDSEQTVQSQLVYKLGANEHVLCLALDQNAKVMNGFLDEDFLNKIHGEQNKYDNDYEPGGKKL